MADDGTGIGTAPRTPHRPRSNALSLEQKIEIRAARASGQFDVPNPHLYRVAGDFMVMGNPVNFQGWKIYMPAPQTYSLSEEYKQVFQTLQTLNIPHKYILMKEYMRDTMNEHLSQLGKFLTIYPDNEEQLRKIVPIIDSLIDTKNFKYAVHNADEHKVGSKQIVTIRYGGNYGKLIMNPEYSGDLEKRTNPAFYQSDDRTKAKPDCVRNPFVDGDNGVDGWVPVATADLTIECENSLTTSSVTLLGRNRERIGDITINHDNRIVVNDSLGRKLAEPATTSTDDA